MNYSPIDTAAAVTARAFFTCDAAELSAACDYLSRRVVERRNTIPIVECLLIEASLGLDGSYPGGAITITGTDLDLAAKITLAAIVESPGAFCTPAHALAETLAKVRKASKGAQVSFDHAEPELDNVNRPKAQRVTVKSGRGRYQLGTLPRDDYPIIALSCETDPIAFALPAAQFLADLAAVGSCASKEETRYYLNGAAMQVRDLAGQDRLCLVATDGHAIAAASRPVPIGATALDDVIIPRKTMAIIGHAAKLAGEVEAVQVTAYGTKLAFDFGAVRIVTKTIDGTFPDWQAPFASNLAASDASPALFPELLPGAPVATIERIAKAAKGMAIDWSPASQGMLGTVPGDDGLLFGAVNMADGGACQRKGFSYHWQGGAEAKAYLESLAESRGLRSAADIQAECIAINDASDALERDQWLAIANGEAPGERAIYCGARLHKQGTRIVGLTVSGERQHTAWRETVTDWEALAERVVQHPARVDPIEGSYSILMPADGPGQLVSESAIEGPDGVTYPVAMSDSAIHLTKEQVRALIGESCFETFAVDMGGNVGTVHFVKWLWEQGDSRLVIVQPNGRCFKVPSRTFARVEIEAALAGEVIEVPTDPISDESASKAWLNAALSNHFSEPIPETGADYAEAMPQPVTAECEPVEAPEPIAIACQPCEAVGGADSVALDSGEQADALSEAVSGPIELSGIAGQLPEPDLAALVADLAARVAAIEGLSVESEARAEAMARYNEGLARTAANPDSYSVARSKPLLDAHGHDLGIRWQDRSSGRRLYLDTVGPCYELERDDVAAIALILRNRAYRAAEDAKRLKFIQQRPDYAHPGEVEELEARLAALSAVSAATPIAERPRRTAAHERAVRRAWAERALRRRKERAEDAALRLAQGFKDSAAAAEAEAADYRAMARQRLTEIGGLEAKRRRAVILAREMQQRAAHYRANWKEEERRAGAAEGKRRGSTVLARYRGGQMVALAGVAKRSEAGLADLKRTMADPTMPERSSDIARLVGERDQARNANAALEQRCARMQAAVDGCAGEIESLVSRVARAEAALRVKAA